MPAHGPPPRPFHLPHIELLLKSLRISRERLMSRSKIAVDTRLLRAMLQSLASQAPFDREFYLKANPDIAAAFASGQIPDLHQHFIESGYFEGRTGAMPEVDEAFYSDIYPDIGAAIASGTVASAAEHYARSGAAEGRLASEAMRAETERWASVLADETQARAASVQ
jgi:hypothetical protein